MAAMSPALKAASQAFSRVNLSIHSQFLTGGHSDCPVVDVIHHSVHVLLKISMVVVGCCFSEGVSVCSLKAVLSQCGLTLICFFFWLNQFRMRSVWWRQYDKDVVVWGAKIGGVVMHCIPPLG